MKRDYNDPEYIRYIENNIRHSKDIYVCMNCFDTKERKVKKEDIVRIPKRTFLYRECDKCGYGLRGVCARSPVGDKLGICDYDEIPVTHRCDFGRTDALGNAISMSELCCPICHKLVHKIIGKNIIISVIGSRDSGKSHYLGVLLHELMNALAEKLDWCVVPEDNTLRMYKLNFERLFSAKQTLSLTGKNHDGYYEPYIFYIKDKKGKTFTITFFDTAGEDFESDDLMENSAKHAFNASGIIFIIDPLKINAVSSFLDSDLLKNSASVSADKAFKIDAVLSILSNSLRRHYRIGETKKIVVPLGILVSKLDVIANFLPQHYALLFKSNHAAKQKFAVGENKRVNTETKKFLGSLGDGQVNSFMAQVALNYSNYSYFGVSSLGLKNAPDKNGIINFPNPHRAEDPLLWILKENGIIDPG